MRDTERRIAAWLLFVIAFLIVYGSLYPFRFAGGDGAGALAMLRTLSFARTTQGDIAANVLLYLPLGACLAWLLGRRLGGLLAAVAATLAGAALSFAIEFAQLFTATRVASLGDLACNIAGSFAGAWVALAIAATHRRIRVSPLAGFLRHPVATALVLAWIGYRLAPFAPVFDLGKWSGAFAPLAAGGWWNPASSAPHALAWLAIAQAAARIVPARPLALVAGAMAFVLLGRVLLAGLALEPAEIAGMAAALALAVPLARLPAERTASVLAALFVVLIAMDGLAPFDFQLAQERFAFLPFAESLTQYRAASLADMFQRCFHYGALVWLLVRGGLPILPATAAGAGVVFSIELLQTWLPGQTAEITDPLLAIAAGGLVAVFERESDG